LIDHQTVITVLTYMFHFYPRDALHSSVLPSKDVRLSVTRRYCV